MNFVNKKTYMLIVALLVCSKLQALPSIKPNTLPSIKPNALPSIIIKAITNNTDQDILLVDRLKNKTITIRAGETQELKSRATTTNVSIQGSMKEIMAQKAQYVIKQARNPDQEVYMHMNAAAGGINDGSGIICGKEGSVIYKFLLAGKNGGMQMDNQTLKNPAACQVEVTLQVSILPWAAQEKVFALDAEYTLNEKERVQKA